MAEQRREAAADTTEVRQLVTGYQAARALLAADELGLVARLEDGPMHVDALAQATETHAPSLRRFMRALATVDLVVEHDDGRFSLGALAPGLRDAARLGVESYRAWAELPHTLRTGEPAFEHVFGKGLYDYLADDAARAERFDSALAAVSRDWAPAVKDAYDFPADATVVDVGGGRGTFIAELLKAYPDADGILFDQPHVVAHAASILQAAGVESRCRVVGGNFFESVPSGADIYTLCNLLTDWDDESGAKILDVCRQAMGASGRVIVIDRVLPPPGDPARRAMAFLDLFFLVLEGGRIRTEAEFETLFAKAGLRVNRTIPTASSFSIVEGIEA